MKSSIVKINNTKDVMCIAIAIMVWKQLAYWDDSGLEKRIWEHIRRSDRPLQTRMAMKLLNLAGIP